MEELLPVLITGYVDTENYLFYFLDIETLSTYTQLSKSHYKFIKKHSDGKNLIKSNISWI